LLRQLAQLTDARLHGFFRHLGSNDDELISAHARHVVVFSTGKPEFLGESPQHASPCSLPKRSLICLKPRKSQTITVSRLFVAFAPR